MALDQLQIEESNASESHFPSTYLCHHKMVLHKQGYVSVLLFTFMLRILYLFFQWRGNTPVLSMRSWYVLRRAQEPVKVVVIPKVAKENTSWIDAGGIDIEYLIYTVDDPLISGAPANKGHEAMVCRALRLAKRMVTGTGLPYIPCRSLQRFTRYCDLHALSQTCMAQQQYLWIRCRAITEEDPTPQDHPVRLCEHEMCT